MISQKIRALAPEQATLRMGMGWTVDDLGKPQIMVESTFGDSHPGSAHLLTLVDAVALGVSEAGGKAARYFATDICDGMAQGHDGINYSLASRDTMSLEFNSTPRCSIDSIETRITCATSALPRSGRRSIFTMPAVCPESWKKSAPCSIWTP